MRQVMALNDGWMFHKGDVPGAQDIGFDDSAWRGLTLPHDWGIEGPFDQRWASATGFLPGGVGWYRKTFDAPASDGIKKVSVHFDGVYCSSEVWINGRSLGVRPNGFISFRYDLTPYLNAHGPNVLAVRVDHSQFADARWYTGSGINRNVSLIVTEPVHIRQWGVFASTPVVTEAQAEVRVEVCVQNDSATGADVQVELHLCDPDGAVVAEAAVPAAIAAGGEQTVHGRLNVSTPRLWSVPQPSLYTLHTRLVRDGQAVDEEQTRVGIREFHFDSDTGFFLNGENIKLKGVCLHDDAGALGTAVPPRVWERRLKRLKEAGVNAIRMAHNPHMPELYDLCDTLGFLVQDEAFDEWELGKNKWIAGWNVGMPGKDGYHPYFEEWAEADLRDMILRDRNHPSVIMWSIGNEIDYPNDPYTHEVLDQGRNPQIYGRGYDPDRSHANRLGEIARRLAAVVKTYDTTRPVTAGLASAAISNETGFAEALDVAGYNYQEYRYAEDHARFPNHVLYGSENGMRWDAWQAVADNAYISGQFLWTGIDYLGEAGQWPTRSNGAGILDLAGFMKPEFFFRQSLWTVAPMVSLGTSAVPQGEDGGGIWRHRQAVPAWRGAEGEIVRVNCFTNCARAELFLNCISQGVRSRVAGQEPTLFWDVPYQPGTLAVYGMNGNEIVCAGELRTSGPAKRLVVVSDVAVLKADGMDLAHIEVAVVDEAGTPAYEADHEISWAIDGPARLLGLESGDHSSHEDYQAHSRKAYHGRLLGYIQATEDPGTVTVTMTAPGLETAAITVRSGT